MTINETPMVLVEKCKECFPEITKRVNSAHSRGESWPDYSPLPIGFAGTLIREWTGLPLDGRYAAELTAAYLWSEHRNVFTFDKDLAQTLLEQAESFSDDEQLPVNVLFHPPFPIMYIKAPEVFDSFDGFFYWVEYDFNKKRPELRFQWLRNDFCTSYPCALDLLPGKTLNECVKETTRLGKDLRRMLLNDVERYDELYGKKVRCALQFVLYLCAANADVEEKALVAMKQTLPSKKKRKDKTRNKVNNIIAIRQFETGVRIGAVIRSAKKEAKNSQENRDSGTGTKKSPHARRGHWHHYWTGPRSGEQTVVLKWIAPTFVHADQLESIQQVVTVYPVAS